MKKNLFMVAAVALMALVSCNKEELGNTTNGVVFTAEFEQDASTKTILGDDKVENRRKALWVVGDKISINGTDFSAVSGGEVAEFKTEADFAEAATYRAVYPAESYKGSGVMIPLSQNGTFENASIAVAESSTQTLVFNNVSSILKFQVPVACKTVTFESINSIAGQVSVSYNNGEMVPNYTSLTNPQKKITVTADFVTGKDYYVAVKPGSQKFTVNIDGKLSKASDKSVTVERTYIHNLGVLPEPQKEENAVIRIKNMNGWKSLNITVKSGNTTVANAVAMKDDGNNIFSYELAPSYVGKSVKYFITYDWYQTSTKTVTLKKDSEAKAIDLNTTYLQPNDWNSDSPRYGAHIWETGKTGIWKSATKVKDNFYEVEIPTDGNYVNIIWCRMNPNNTNNDWGSVWNQTGDLTLQHKCYCIQANDAWNKPTGNYWY